jgi:hypothetical protein
VFVADDDLEISAEAISRLFEIRLAHNLDVLQPAYLPTGRVSHAPLMVFPGCFGRLTNFVEVTCPLFRSSSLIRFLDTYDGSLVGWGIDWWFMEMLWKAGERRAAVIDAVPCRNPHTNEKGLQVREIDVLQSAGDRAAAWAKKKKELGLQMENGGIRILGELGTREISGPTPRISVIVEWENALLASDERLPSLFAALASELAPFQSAAELLALFDPDTIDREALKTRIVRQFVPACPSTPVRFVEAPALHYYELKNRGVLEAQGDIVVFADSDIVPEPGWLGGLVGTLDSDCTLGMVAGHTDIAPSDIVGKAFAASWFFPLRPSAITTKTPAAFLWANNCAYRRNVFLAYPFRTEAEGQTRGACGRQLRELIKAGIRTANVPALVSHPPPNGVRHVVVRALAEGRDHMLSQIRPSTPPLKRLAALLRRIMFAARRIGDTVRNAVSPQSRRTLGADIHEIPAIIAIMLGYYVFYCAGSVAAAVSPGWASRR